MVVPASLLFIFIFYSYSRISAPCKASNTNYNLHSNWSFQVKDTLQESVSFLERCLKINRDISIPNMRTFQELPPPTTTTELPPTNGETETSAMTNHRQDAERESLPVLSKDQFLCLLYYDLGSLYFHQRLVVTATEMFNRAAVTLPSVRYTSYKYYF